MDINFQDRIDEYLLHPDRLSEEEKSQFLSELEADPQKRAQFELTRDVRLAVTSRARKMSRMEEMRTMYGHVRSHVAMNCLTWRKTVRMRRDASGGCGCRVLLQP